MGVIGFYGVQDDYGAFSNFYPAIFKVDDKEFYWSEQFLMYQKAKLFGDEEIADKILRVSGPLEAKKLGRKVANFDSEIWEAKCEELFFPGLYAKFAQNPALRVRLLETGYDIICECAPRDVIWGIGMGKTNPDYTNPLKWRGKNRQGKLLMMVREALRKEFV